ncbi:MAG: DNA topoisomerase IB [Chloroflexi bacterium]|nr:MAG: DNA topoisomerase IB [Chloroflexota bacterium]
MPPSSAARSAVERASSPTRRCAGLVSGLLSAVVVSNEIASDGVAAAQLAGLRYTSDDRPGIRRKRKGRGFVYVDSDGVPIDDDAELQRIRRLAIPPAWTEVWISSSPTGHIQATGRDARGRKQYRYHERWREVRDEAKYSRLSDFARALPRVRARVDADLARPGIPRERVLATAVRILEETFMRVGNVEYARANGSFGLTTLRSRHVDVDGSRIVFHFRGKSGKDHEVDVRDRRLARVVARLEQLPGQELFKYRDDDGELRPIGSEDVNAYLREISGEDMTAKDFRTWAGTVLAARALAERGPARNERVTRKRIVQAIDVVAARLGNTRAICRKCYVHPLVLEAHTRGSLPAALRRPDKARKGQALSTHEAAVAALLARAEKRAAKRAA